MNQNDKLQSIITQEGQYFKNGTQILISNEININQKVMQIEEQRGSFYRPKWQLKTKGSPHPLRRWCHTATIHNGHLYIIGGRLAQSAKVRDFVYRVNCETFLSQPIQLSDNPMSRDGHSSVLVKDSIYVMFGIIKAGKILNDCIELKIGQNCFLWSKKCQTPQIEARESHMSVILDDRFILIYGGQDPEQKLITDFHMYDIEEQTWRRIQKVQGNIQGKVGGALINIKNQIYLFGGQINDQNQYSNQIYKIQIKNYKNTNPQQVPQIIINKINVSGSKPSPRSQFASVPFKDRYLIIVGGQGPTKQNKDNPQLAKVLLNDIWAFDTQKRAWQEIVPENANIFKPRSSLTANIYKQNLIIFGGLVSLKGDFRTSDEIFVLNLNPEPQKKPLCTLCRSSYKALPQQQIEVENAKAVKNYRNFYTSFSTISAIARTIQNPFAAISTLFHSFDPFGIEQCVLLLKDDKLMLNLKNMKITDIEWQYVLQSYEYVPLIQQVDDRIKKALVNEIHRNLVNYLSYNIKNCCLRLGNQLLLSWVNEKKELEIFLINKFGIYQSTNINTEHQYSASQQSIILQYLKEKEIDIVRLYQNALTLCVTSLKKQLSFNNGLKDIMYESTNLKDYLQTAYVNQLSFNLMITNNIEDNRDGKFFKIGQNNKDKWPQQNDFSYFFEDIFTYEKQGKSTIYIYQNNKLMHQKKLKENNDIAYEFHLTKNIESNLTFSDVLVTNDLINAIQSVIKKLNQKIDKDLKRNRSATREQNIEAGQEGQISEPNMKKILKLNEAQTYENEIQVEKDGKMCKEE